jgi:hypothetical protein
MTNQPDSIEAKTSNPRQQEELSLSPSARTPLVHLLRSLRFVSIGEEEVCQVHGERRRPREETERNRLRLLEIINEAEQIIDDNSDLNNPSSAGGLQQPRE